MCYGIICQQPPVFTSVDIFSDKLGTYHCNKALQHFMESKEQHFENFLFLMYHHRNIWLNSIYDPRKKYIT